MPSYFVGLDLGQIQDYTALSLIEKLDDSPIHHVRGLRRWQLRTPYPDIVRDVMTMLDQTPFHWTTGAFRTVHHTNPVMLAVDGTGCGAAVVDLFRHAVFSKRHIELVPILIHGGDTISIDGDIRRVPKRDLVSCVQLLLQKRELKIAADLPEASTLVRELQNFQVRITTHANDIYGAWREGTHDDLVLSVALACWTSRYSSFEQEDPRGAFAQALAWRGK
jgi:hypothetical protein